MKKMVDLMNNLNKFKQCFKDTCNDESLRVEKFPDCFILKTNSIKLFVSLTNPNENEKYSEYIEVNINYFILNKIQKCSQKYQEILKKASKKLDVEEIKAEIVKTIRKSQSISNISEISQPTDEYDLSDENEDETLALEALQELNKLKIVKKKKN